MCNEQEMLNICMKPKEYKRQLHIYLSSKVVCVYQQGNSINY